MARLYARALCQVVWSRLHHHPRHSIPIPSLVHHSSYYLLRSIRCRDRVLRCRRRELPVYLQYQRVRARNRWMGNAIVIVIVLSCRPLRPLHLPSRSHLLRDLECHNLHPHYRLLLMHHLLPIGSRYL
jgi:hypothetical protein